MIDWLIFTSHSYLPLEFRKNIRTEMKGCWFQTLSHCKLPWWMTVQWDEIVLPYDPSSEQCLYCRSVELRFCVTEWHYTFPFSPDDLGYLLLRDSQICITALSDHRRLPGSYYPTVLPSSFLYCNGVSEEYINYSAQIQLKFHD